ncbi:MAG: histidine kinase [Nocardioidaceae bacterium]
MRVTTPDPPSPLTGDRSGEKSYDRHVGSLERMQRAVRAMDSISRVLVRTVEGPRALLEEVAGAAAAHLNAEWTILALSDGELQGARPRFVTVDADGVARADEELLPAYVRRELGSVRAGRVPRPREDAGWVRVPMTLEGRRVGHLVARHRLEEEPEPADLSVLRILANQAAISLHTSEQYQRGLSLHRRAQRLYDEATAQARDLAARTADLRRAEARLQLAQQRELIDTERHRIARELHDTVTQYVLSAGMAVEIARGDVQALEGADAVGTDGLLARLTTAKNLSQEAVEQLRRAIYALHQPHRDTVSSLPDLLQEVARQHKTQMHVQRRVEGDVVPLADDADHEIARAVGEALFNVAAHAGATRALVRLRYRPDEVLVSVADNGHGDPRELGRILRLECAAPVNGRHRGLATSESRMAELGGRVGFRRSRLGGVRVEIRIPLPIVEADRPRLIRELAGHPGGE